MRRFVKGRRFGPDRASTTLQRCSALGRGWLAVHSVADLLVPHLRTAVEVRGAQLERLLPHARTFPPLVGRRLVYHARALDEERDKTQVHAHLADAPAGFTLEDRPQVLVPGGVVRDAQA